MAQTVDLLQLLQSTEVKITKSYSFRVIDSVGKRSSCSFSNVRIFRFSQFPIIICTFLSLQGLVTCDLSAFSDVSADSVASLALLVLHQIQDTQTQSDCTLLFCSTNTFWC